MVKVGCSEGTVDEGLRGYSRPQSLTLPLRRLAAHHRFEPASACSIRFAVGDRERAAAVDDKIEPAVGPRQGGRRSR